MAIDSGGLTDLLHCAQMINRHLDAVMQEKIGIGWSQFRIMDVVQCDETSRQRTIARNLGQTEASVSRQVSLLCDRGLLTTETSSQNRREHALALTAKGVRMTDAARVVLHDCARTLSTDMPERQQNSLQNALDILHLSICRPGKPFGCR